MDETCKEHSGCKAEIDQLKKDRDTDRDTMRGEIFPRLRSIERQIWIAQGAGFIVMMIIQRYWK